MAKLKYAQNIITDPKMHPMPAGFDPGIVSLAAGAMDFSQMRPVSFKSITPAEGAARMTRLLWLDSEVLKGAFYMDFVWYHAASDSGPGPHTHDFDEVLGFLGTDPKNPKELGGEIELWLDDEKYSLTHTCLVFAPRGLRHCPMIARKVTTPFIHFTTGNGGTYEKSVK
jgi:hypothetical protein